LKTQIDSLIECSGKMVLLSKFFPKLKKEGHKILVFSQMTNMLDLLEEFCNLMGYKYERIDGSVRGNVRQASIDRFSDPSQDRFIFLLSTRAGGVGINLTAADTCVIFDSDWNPQNDIQAQARCHRIGQTQAVKIFRLITTNSYEATMFEKSSRKLGLEQAVFGHGIGNNDDKAGAPSKDEIELLLRHGAYGNFGDDKAAEERVRVFIESDINQLLERSRVIKLEKHDESESGESSHMSRLKGLSFSKTTFVSDTADGEVDVNDPDFWAKVLGKDSRETLLNRLMDGTATATPESTKAFLVELKDLHEAIIDAKLQGISNPPFIDNAREALVQLISLKKSFSQSERDEANEWLQEIERPTRRKRKAVLDANQEAEVEKLLAPLKVKMEKPAPKVKKEKPAPREKTEKPVPKVKTEKGSVKSKAKVKDPSKPKQSISAYMFYAIANRDRVKAENEGITFGEVAKRLGVEWKALSAEEKKTYEEKAAADKKLKAELFEETKGHEPQEKGKKRLKVKQNQLQFVVKDMHASEGIGSCSPMPALILSF
jgi:hypothetical protein